MKSEKEVLSSILKTAQMGQVGIRAVMPMASRVELQNALYDQLTEYNSIEGSAQKIAHNNGWQLKGLDPVAKKMSQMYAKFNLSYGNVDSKIAAMMIQGNMRGLIKGIKNAHHSKACGQQVISLSQKLQHCEEDNIKQMQGYL